MLAAPLAAPLAALLSVLTGAAPLLPAATGRAAGASPRSVAASGAPALAPSATVVPGLVPPGGPYAAVRRGASTAAAASALASGLGAHVRVTPQDRAATYAYLKAQYAYGRAVAANMPASLAQITALAGRLAHECPSVLAGAPPPAPFPGPGEEAKPMTARQEGEASRLERQRGELRSELSYSLVLAFAAPDRRARLALERAVRRLHWSSRALTRYVRSSVSSTQATVEPAAPDVCADMRAWAQSGFRTVSAQTKAFTATLQAAARHLLASVPRRRRGDPLALLERSAGPRGRALERKLRRLLVRLLSQLKSSMKLEANLRKALGIEEPPEPPSSLHPPGSQLIAHGRAADGTKYEVWLPPSSSQHRSHGCDVSIDVEESQTRHRKGRLVIGGGGGGSTDCLSRSHPRRVALYCADGRFRVEGQTKPAARRARLRLADGRTIASKVAIVPASAGGPMGFYLQLVPGKGPAPVSLTELDRHGHAIATIRFKHMGPCVARPVRPPEPLPGGTRTLARGRVPGGPRFAIRGEGYRFMGHVHFRLTATVESRPGLLFGVGSASGSVTFPAGPGSGKRSPFHMEQESGCQPREYALIYGILRKPGDTVLARTSSGLHALHRVHIPQALHANGDLAYIALDSMPTEVIVRSASGKPVAHQDLRSQARDLRERCEGEAEG